VGKGVNGFAYNVLEEGKMSGSKRRKDRLKDDRRKEKPHGERDNQKERSGKEDKSRDDQGSEGGRRGRKNGRREWKGAGIEFHSREYTGICHSILGSLPGWL